MKENKLNRISIVWTLDLIYLIYEYDTYTRTHTKQSRLIRKKENCIQHKVDDIISKDPFKIKGKMERKNHIRFFSFMIVRVRVSEVERE